MTQTEEKKQRKPLRGLLVASLALNLLVVGVVGGAIIAHGGPGDGDGPRISDRYGTPYIQALSRQDRRAVGKEIRRAYLTGGYSLKGDKALYQETVTVLRAETFDAEALNTALRDIDVSAEGRRDLARQKLVARIEAMSEAERAEYADRLEEVLRRNPHDRKKDGKKDGDKKPKDH